MAALAEWKLDQGRVWGAASWQDIAEGNLSRVHGMSPQQLAVVIDALGVGLWGHHMLHGAKAVPPELFSQAVALLLDGIAVRATTTVGGAV